MTLSPSWAFCNDIGGANSGAVSGSMNMVGNIGAALSAIMFPFFQDEVTGSANRFFVLAAGMNFIAIVAWSFMNPNRVSDRKLSPAAIRKRFIAMLTALILLTLGAVSYKIYTSTRKEPVPTDQTESVDTNDVNNVTTEEIR